MKLRIMTALAILSLVISGFTVFAWAKQITTNSYEDISPHIKGNYLTWQGRVCGNWEVFLYNISTGEITQVTSNSYGDISPRTDGRYVVWLGFSNSGGEIFMYDISTGMTTKIIDDNNIDSRPHIANGLVVWSSQEVTTVEETTVINPNEVFLYSTATQQTMQLTDNTLDNSARGINDAYVIWVQKKESTVRLFLYDLASGLSHEAPSGFVWKDSDQTDGDLTVCTRVVGSDREIFVRDHSLGNYKQITENDIKDESPCISGKHIAWVEDTGKSSEISLATVGGDCDMDGDMDGSDLAIFVYNYAILHLDADLNNDCHVDTDDLALFAKEFGRINCP